MGLSPESDLQLDAITRYLLTELKPQTRLDYYLLSSAEKDVLRAICSYSPNGEACKKSFQTLAVRASMSRKNVQRVINGYTRENGTKALGLKARGIVSELAPAQPKWEKAATLGINWHAFTIDPKKVHILQYRMQGTLTGMKRPLAPEEEAANEQASSKARVVQNPVEAVLPPGQDVHRPLDKMARPSGQDVHTPLDRMSIHNLFSSLNTSLSAKSFAGVEQRGVVHIVAPQPNPEPSTKASFPNKSPKSAWQTLHRGLLKALERELASMSEADVGLNTYGWSPEQIAESNRQKILAAAARAKIWPHVAEKLAEETYQAVLDDELRRAPKFDS